MLWICYITKLYVLENSILKMHRVHILYVIIFIDICIFLFGNILEIAACYLYTHHWWRKAAWAIESGTHTSIGSLASNEDRVFDSSYYKIDHRRLTWWNWGARRHNHGSRGHFGPNLPWNVQKWQGLEVTMRFCWFL